MYITLCKLIFSIKQLFSTVCGVFIVVTQGVTFIFILITVLQASHFSFLYAQ